MMLTEKKERAYTAFFNAAQEDDVLDRRTIILISLAVSMAVGCGP